MPTGQRNTVESILSRLVICEPSALPTGCWEWSGGRSWLGYGVVCYQGKKRPVHVFVYEHFVGPVPEGLELDHLCRNRACGNFEHVEPVTHLENVRRGAGPPQRHWTHCSRGHEFSSDNIYVDPLGRRNCRTCRIEAKRRFRDRLKEKSLGTPVDIIHTG